MSESVYLLAQSIQLLLLGALAWRAHSVLRARHESWRSAPTLVVLLGYGVACVCSNTLRSLRGDRTALWIISEGEYMAGTLAWMACFTLAVLSYLTASARCSRRKRSRSDRGVVLSRRLEFFFLGMASAGPLGHYFNPFRIIDFGHLNPTSPEAIPTGGLLVAGAMRALTAAGAIPLLILRPVVGLPFAAATVGIETYSGSKALGTVFALYVVWLLYRLRRQIRFRLWALGGVALMLLAARYSLTEATAYRFGQDEITLENAVAASVARFTQQEVAAVIWARPEWRSDFQVRYVVDNLLSFIPGFLWADKPRNPAYEINELYAWGGPVSAASPSVFGSLLIAVGPWLLLPAAAMLGRLAGRTDRLLTGLPGYVLVEWTYIYFLVGVFETVYVLATVQFVMVKLIVGVLRRAELEPLPERRSPVSAQAGGDGRVPYRFQASDWRPVKSPV